jgi:hypothetical protein
MGAIKLFGGSAGRCASETYHPADPRPNLFKIKEIKQIGKFVLAVVNYPNCTEYNGDKILIYDFVSVADVASQKLLDPHFIMPRSGVDKGVYPVARFVADWHGRMLAESFCKNCPGEVED